MYDEEEVDETEPGHGMVITSPYSATRKGEYFIILL